MIEPLLGGLENDKNIYALEKACSAAGKITYSN